LGRPGWLLRGLRENWAAGLRERAARLRLAGEVQSRPGKLELKERSEFVVFQIFFLLFQSFSNDFKSSQICTVQ
jgi:hypothetical protein